MKVAIIGVGNVGRALATVLTRAGHDVAIASRDREEAGELASSVGARAANARDAVESAEVVVLAVPFTSLQDVAREIADVAAGKAVVDVTNPLKPTYDGLVTEGGPSAAELLQTWLPDSAVIKAFNTLTAANMVDPVVDGVQLDAFVAGTDAPAKQKVLDLAGSIGLRPVDAGPLPMARYLEAMMFLNISLNVANGWDWRSGWKLVGIPVPVPA